MTTPVLPRQRLAIDAAGRANLACWIRSPNQDPRPDGNIVELVVVHGISLPPGVFGGNGVRRLFTNRLESAAHPYFAGIAHLRVSAHFFVRRDGQLEQYVACTQRAWHAGASEWRGRPRCNDYSIGIELEGTDEIPYTGKQYSMLARLMRALRRRYPIAAVVGHCEIAPLRKTDPGPAFDWNRLSQLLAPRSSANRLCPHPRL